LTPIREEGGVSGRDQEIIAGFLANDGEAVATVSRWILQAGFPFRRRLAEDWEDTVQDVLAEVTRLLRQASFRGDSTLKTYLWRVTSNACVDRIRSRTRVQWEGLEEVEERPPSAAPAGHDPSEAEAKDIRLRVLAEMSDDCKQLWRMLFEGLSYRQMGERLGVTEGALRVRVLRCRKRALALREELLGIAVNTAVTLLRRPQPIQGGR
jgi:RNA polymerase sigma factor (sigma-70 family)